MEDDKKGDNLSINYNVALEKVKSYKDLGVKFAISALTNTGFESAFLELNCIFQNTMMKAASVMYVHFLSPNSPIISNRTVVILVEKYIELVPVHYSVILTMLNVRKEQRINGIIIC